MQAQAIITQPVPFKENNSGGYKLLNQGKGGQWTRIYQHGIRLDLYKQSLVTLIVFHRV